MVILILSNGMGEDQIACHLIRAFQALYPEAHFLPVPLVGEGQFYRDMGLTPVIRNPIFPSGGFIRSFSVLTQDLKAGLLSHLFFQLKTIKQLAKQGTLTLAVGDLFCLLMARHRNASPIFFLPTAKSDSFMPHSRVERWIMKAFASAIFTRDSLTANALSKAQLPAFYLGNVMMDGLNAYSPLELSSDLPVIGILPGSRLEAYDNFVFCCDVLDLLGYDAFQYLISVPPTLDIERLQRLSDPRPLLFSDNFKGILHAADVIIGLSGTANEQAMHLGKPVIAFEGFGPQTTLQRFQEQQKLMDGRLILVHPRTASRIAHQILTTFHALKNESPLPASPGAASAIVSEILRIFKAGARGGT